MLERARRAGSCRATWCSRAGRWTATTRSSPQRWFGDADEAARAAGGARAGRGGGARAHRRRARSTPARRTRSSRSTRRRPPPSQLPEIAHWIAPEEVPVRFDARYFAVAAPRGLEPAPDGGEAAARLVGGAAAAPRRAGRRATASSTGPPTSRCCTSRSARPSTTCSRCGSRPASPTRPRWTRSAVARCSGRTDVLRIVRVLAPNPDVYTLEGTNTWIVGEAPSVVIDPGPDDPAHLDEVARVAGRVGAVLVTHDHPDHAPGAAAFAEAASGAAARVPAARRGAPARRPGRARRATRRSRRSTRPGTRPTTSCSTSPSDGRAVHRRRRARPGDELHRPARGRPREVPAVAPAHAGAGARTLYPGHGPVVMRRGRRSCRSTSTTAPSAKRRSSPRSPTAAARSPRWSRRSTRTTRPRCIRSRPARCSRTC